LYYVYSGNGSVEDTSGIKRALHASMLISDQLRTLAGAGPAHPVHLSPGQPLPNGQYQFKILDWRIMIESIGIFFGQSGRIYIAFKPDGPNSGIIDREWHLNSDAAPYYYDWGKNIDFMEQPNNWVDPASPDYGHLFRKMTFNATDLGQSIGQLFSSIPKFVLTRH